MTSLEELFCSADDFCKKHEGCYEQKLLGHGVRQSQRSKQLCQSEIMTIIIGFHQSHYRNFKSYYLKQVGELLNITVSSGNTDDRKPVSRLLLNIVGKVFADKGHISASLAKSLLQSFGVQLITKFKSNMKNRLIPLNDLLLLRKRAIVETVIDQLKNISQIEHSCYRSPVNFMVNVLAGLIAYCHQPKKSSLYFDSNLKLSA